MSFWEFCSLSAYYFSFFMVHIYQPRIQIGNMGCYEFTYLTMIIYQETSSKHKEIVATLVPLVQIYKKNEASSKAVSDLVERMATALERMEYAPKEISGIDRRSFFDIIKEWMATASAQDISVIKSVFQV
jgi:hypothetical protein